MIHLRHAGISVTPLHMNLLDSPRNPKKGKYVILCKCVIVPNQMEPINS